METLSSLYLTNTWWRTGKVDQALLSPHPRSELAPLMTLLPERRITAVIGPRRVGKSTLLLQAIDHLLATGVSPQRILHLSGDNPTLLDDAGNFGNLFDSFAADILHEPWQELLDPVYIFIDEIHHMAGWQKWLKHYYDQKLKIKFVISGSSSSHLFYESAESLLGRIENLYVLPLGARQFIEFFQAYKKDVGLNEFYQLLPCQSVFSSPCAYAKELMNKKAQLDFYRPAVQGIIQEYLLAGGYPEYFETKSLARWQKRLTEDIIARGLYRDIVNFFNVKHPDVLEKLLYVIAGHNGQAFSYASLGQSLGIDGTTAASYISYLASAMLVTVAENYSSNAGKVIRKNKKLYILDNGLCNALRHLNDLTPDNEGMLVENSCAQQARLFAEANGQQIFYWREDKAEVDIVLDQKLELLPIEVKYRGEIKKRDVSGVHSFKGHFNCPSGLVITKDKLAVEEEIAYVPFWLIT